MKKPQTGKSKPKAKTKTEKPKAVKAAPEKKAAAAKAAVGHNSADPKLRELFLNVHQPAINRHLEAVKSATGKLRKAYKDALADGFTKNQFDTARQLSTPEGEDVFRTKLAETVAAAMYIGSDIGGLLGQLDLFGPSRTDASERAYDEGQKASIENRQAKPDYAPGTAQYESYMKGFSDHQAGIASGFKSVDKGAKPATERKRQAKAEKEGTAPEGAPEPEADAPPPPPPTSGQPLSRAEYNRLQMQEAEQHKSQFSKAN